MLNKNQPNSGLAFTGLGTGIDHALWLNTWHDHVNFEVETTQHVVLLARAQESSLFVPWIKKSESGIWNVECYKKQIGYAEVKLLDRDSRLLCEAKINLSVTKFSGYVAATCFS